MKTLISSDDKDALIAALLERIDVLVAQNAALMASNASLAARVVALEAKLGLPYAYGEGRGNGACEFHRGVIAGREARG